MNDQDAKSSSRFFDDLMLRKAKSVNQVKTDASSAVNHSGNSDVDVKVNVNVDTMPIALAFLVLSYANKQIDRQQFEEAVEKLLEVNKQYQKTTESYPGDSKVKLMKDQNDTKIWGRY
ncbi:hypothetical protein [Bacillus marasmi]|uniref:hypothetical protein n=1 Tax=Bacillus marasmi TaxID=1926279 RepID=UPI0011CA7AC3|nr:hypothetical protein [Bacillus marasmi]